MVSSAAYLSLTSISLVFNIHEFQSKSLVEKRGQWRSYPGDSFLSSRDVLQLWSLLVPYLGATLV
jgi:hypothetical protein